MPAKKIIDVQKSHLTKQEKADGTHAPTALGRTEKLEIPQTVRNNPEACKLWDTLIEAYNYSGYQLSVADVDPLAKYCLLSADIDNLREQIAGMGISDGKIYMDARKMLAGEIRLQPQEGRLMGFTQR